MCIPAGVVIKRPQLLIKGNCGHTLMILCIVWRALLNGPPSNSATLSLTLLDTVEALSIADVPAVRNDSKLKKLAIA